MSNVRTDPVPLERHRLAPKSIAPLPSDVVNGQPLKYRRTDESSFILYSVGWNETDEGGNVVLTKRAGLILRKATGSGAIRTINGHLHHPVHEIEARPFYLMPIFRFKRSRAKTFSIISCGLLVLFVEMCRNQTAASSAAFSALFVSPNSQNKT